MERGSDPFVGPCGSTRRELDSEEYLPGARACWHRCAASHAFFHALQKQQTGRHGTAPRSSLRPYLVRAGLFATVTMGRSSGSRIDRHTTPSPRPLPEVAFVAFVPGYSGGTATDSNRLPYSFTRIHDSGEHPFQRRRLPRVKRRINSGGLCRQRCVQAEASRRGSGLARCLFTSCRQPVKAINITDWPHGGFRICTAAS